MNGKSPAVGMAICAAIILVLSFTEWGSFQVKVNRPRMSGPMFNRNMFPSHSTQMNATITGWRGNLILAGVRVPNYIPILGALAVGMIALVHLASVGTLPPVVSIVLSALGSLFMLAVLVIIGANGQLAAGSVLTFLGFVAMLVFSIMDARQPAPAYAGGQADQE